MSNNAPLHRNTCEERELQLKISFVIMFSMYLLYHTHTNKRTYEVSTSYIGRAKNAPSKI